MDNKSLNLKKYPLFPLLKITFIILIIKLKLVLR